jgi:hypothetical protein
VVKPAENFDLRRQVSRVGRTLLYLRRRHEARQMDALRERIDREGLNDENRTEGLRLLRQSADGHNAIRRAASRSSGGQVRAVPPQEAIRYGRCCGRKLAASSVSERTKSDEP